MKAMELAESQKGSCCEIAITPIFRSFRTPESELKRKQSKFECYGLVMSVMQPFGIGKLYGLQ
jgi:hypothetical protein